MRNCCVVGCTNNSRRTKKGQRYRFFSIPSNADLREEWLAIINRKNFTPSKHTTVCDEHFVEGEPSVYYPVPCLKMGYHTPIVKRLQILHRSKTTKPQTIVKKLKMETSMSNARAAVLDSHNYARVQKDAEAPSISGEQSASEAQKINNPETQMVFVLPNSKIPVSIISNPKPNKTYEKLKMVSLLPPKNVCKSKKCKKQVVSEIGAWLSEAKKFPVRCDNFASGQQNADAVPVCDKQKASETQSTNCRKLKMVSLLSNSSATVSNNCSGQSREDTGASVDQKSSKPSCSIAKENGSLRASCVEETVTVELRTEVKSHEEIVDVSAMTSNSTGLLSKDLDGQKNVATAVNHEEMDLRACVSAESLTNGSKDQIIAALRQKVRILNNTVKQQTKDGNKRKRFGIDDIRESDAKIRFYTGFPTYAAFNGIFEKLEKKKMVQHMSVNNKARNHHWTQTTYITKPGPKRSLLLIEEFLLVMMKLHKGYLEEDLAYRFGMHQTTVSRISTQWMPLLARFLKKMIRKAEEKQNVGKPFKKFPHIRDILDCLGCLKDRRKKQK